MSTTPEITIDLDDYASAMQDLLLEIEEYRTLRGNLDVVSDSLGGLLESHQRELAHIARIRLDTAALLGRIDAAGLDQLGTAVSDVDSRLEQGLDQLTDRLSHDHAHAGLVESGEQHQRVLASILERLEQIAGSLTTLEAGATDRHQTLSTMMDRLIRTQQILVGTSLFIVICVLVIGVRVLF